LPGAAWICVRIWLFQGSKYFANEKFFPRPESAIVLGLRRVLGAAVPETAIKSDGADLQPLRKPENRTSGFIFTPAFVGAYQTFYFPTAISVTSGVHYYFQPVIQSGDDFDAFGSYTSYIGGAEYYQGAQLGGNELWFQEGIVAAPEPSSSLLLLLGTGILFYVRRRK
jgi:hypothetical protein